MKEASKEETLAWIKGLEDAAMTAESMRMSSVMMTPEAIHMRDMIASAIKWSAKQAKDKL